MPQSTDWTDTYFRDSSEKTRRDLATQALNLGRAALEAGDAAAALAAVTNPKVARLVRPEDLPEKPHRKLSN